MTLPRYLAESPAVQALGWTLFHLLWEGSAIALALAVVHSFARSPKVRYAAACAAMGVVLSCFAITFVRLRGSERAWNVSPPVRQVLLPGAKLPDFATDIAAAESMDLAAWAASLWLAGVAIFYVRAAGGWISVRRWRSTGVCAPNDIWMERFAGLMLRLRISKPVVLLQSSLAEVPVTMGYLRPAILLPVGLLTGLPAHQIEYILLHELAHIRRHDYLVNLLQTLTEGLLFYHPAVWWISGVIRAERENCCDDVAAGQGDPQEYAATLAALEEYRQTGKEPALAATGGNLMKRIRRLLKQPERPRAALTPVLSAGLIVLSMGLAMAYQVKQTNVIGLGQPERNAPAVARKSVVAAMPKAEKTVVLLAQANSQTTAAPERQRRSTAELQAFQTNQGTVTPLSPEEHAALLRDPYATKWLTQDVAYIITQEERAAFLNLTSDEEREHFVEQFWMRRDPTPGTDSNEYKQEHYRRIAYTNQRFADRTTSGWKTDRGRIYISFGPPDEIDSHPSGGKYTRPAEQGGGEAMVAPFEQWRYKWIQGVGENVVIEFVDLALNGEFHMTMDPREKETGTAK
jgi:GWxTD domain-containing protein